MSSTAELRLPEQPDLSSSGWNRTALATGMSRALSQRSLQEAGTDKGLMRTIPFRGHILGVVTLVKRPVQRVVETAGIAPATARM